MTHLDKIIIALLYKILYCSRTHLSFAFKILKSKNAVTILFDTLRILNIQKSHYKYRNTVILYIHNIKLYMSPPYLILIRTQSLTCFIKNIYTYIYIYIYIHIYIYIYIYRRLGKNVNKQKLLHNALYSQADVVRLLADTQSNVKLCGFRSQL